MEKTEILAYCLNLRQGPKITRLFALLCVWKYSSTESTGPVNDSSSWVCRTREAEEIPTAWLVSCGFHRVIQCLVSSFAGSTFAQCQASSIFRCSVNARRLNNSFKTWPVFLCIRTNKVNTEALLCSPHSLGFLYFFNVVRIVKVHFHSDFELSGLVVVQSLSPALAGCVCNKLNQH